MKQFHILLLLVVSSYSQAFVVTQQPSSSSSSSSCRGATLLYNNINRGGDDDDNFPPRRRRRSRPINDDDDDDDYYEYYEDNDDIPYDDLGRSVNVPSSFGRRTGWRLPESVSKSLLAGVFVLGVGLGVTVDSQVNTNPKDLASRDAIDQAAPNPTLCAKLGASAMAFDQRVFVSFNPFNVYVSQADVKPACVLREANVVPVLRAKGLINDQEVRACKQNMNTWAFVGNLEDTPQLSCVYKSQDAQNEFLSNPKLGIGEDYLDDDLANLKNIKSIKGAMTEGQIARKLNNAGSFDFPIQ